MMRTILKLILQTLSSLAVKKHEIKIIVINGWLGVEIVKEGIYSVLEEKYIVRRNTRPVWWDLSIPLNILGYKDMRRGWLSWIYLILRSVFVLITGKKNQHTIVLSASSERSMTAKYWSSFIKPEILVIVNHKKDNPVADELIKSTLRNDGTIIYQTGLFNNIPKKNSFTYGTSESDVNYKSNKNYIEVEYKKRKIKYKNLGISPNEAEIFATLFATAKQNGLEFEDIIAGLSKFDFRNILLQKISDTL